MPEKVYLSERIIDEEVAVCTVAAEVLAIFTLVCTRVFIIFSRLGYAMEYDHLRHQRDRTTRLEQPGCETLLRWFPAIVYYQNVDSLKG